MLSTDLKKSILDMAFKGELVPQSNDDEPASILMESIGNNLTISDEVPYEIPDTWVWTKLIHIIKEKPRNGYSAKDVPFPTNVKNLTLTATTSGVFKPEAYKYINEDIPEDSYLWLKDGDLLIQRSNSDEYVGTSCIYHGKEHEFIYPDLMMKMNVKEPICLEYVHYALSSPMVRQYFKDKSTGTAGNMPKINQGVVSNTMIPIAPYNEQLRIVKRIEQFLEKIQELAIFEEELESIDSRFSSDLKNSILQEAMQGKLTEQNPDESVDELFAAIQKRLGRKLKAIPDDEPTFEIPDNWRWIRLVDCAEIYTGNSIAEDVKLKKYTNKEEGYNYIATKDVLFNHTVEYENGVKIPYNESGFKHAESGDILLCIEGGSAGRKIAMLSETVCFGNKLCDFHAYEIDKKFLYYYLQSPCFTSIFKDKLTGIIGGVGINKVRNLLLPVPPLEEQKRIVEQLDKYIPVCVK